MKKLLSILTLLMCFSSGVWADEDSYVADSRHAAEVTSESSYNGTAFSISKSSAYEVAKNKSTATANDASGLTFDYGFLPSGTTSTSNAYTLTALTDISSIKIYYTMSDSKFTTKDQSKSGNLMYKINEDDAVASATTGNKSNKVAYVETISNISKNDVIKIFSSASRLVIFGVYATYTVKTVATQAYAGVKKGTTTLTEGDDFTKSENTITLTNAHKTTTAPTDVKLINHKTFTDSSTEDEDVDVVFGATASEGYFTGTATIALTTYTVKVPHDATPSLVADKANITVTSAKIATGTAKIHLSGVNLAGTNVTLAFASTVAGLSIDKTSVAIAEGAVDTDVTVSYQSNVDVAEANVNLTISTTGVSDIVIPVTYSSTEAVTTIADVTEGIVWDFANAGSSDISSPDQNNNVPFANADGFNTEFGYDKLSGKGQYFYYKDNKCYQGSQLKFRTTVSGNIVVEFSNTGSSSRPYRYLSVNGVVTDYMSKNADKVTTAAIPVPVGDVNIVGIMGTTSGDDCEPTATENMLRIYKVTFTPSANITDAEWATTVTPDYAVDFADGVKAYIVESVGEAITLKEIEDAPANTPIIVNASKGSYTMTKKATATSDVNDNKLEAATGAEIGNGAGNFYVLGMTSTGVGFGKLADGVTLAKGKAFIPGSAWTSSKDFLPFVIGDEENETTSINSMENSELRIENSDYFNLSGQRVGKDYKGIVIKKGKKIVK